MEHKLVGAEGLGRPQSNVSQKQEDLSWIPRSHVTEAGMAAHDYYVC